MKRKTFLLGGAALLSGGLPSAVLGRKQGAGSDAPFLTQGKTDLAYLRKIVEARLDELEKSLAQNKPVGPSTRNLPNGALASLYLGRAPERAEALLRRLFGLQEMDEKSPHYGEVPWQAGRPEIVDRNAEVFSSQAVGPMLLAYGDKLSPDFKAELKPHVKAFFAALQRRSFKTPAYTNIYVMRFVSTILMGEAIGDTEMAAQGYAWLDDWLRYTSRAGIHEFNSPTYTAVDLNSFYLGYRFAKKPKAKEMFKAILDYFWTDLTANYFAGRGSYSGPHSRDYDFIGGWGGGVGYYYSACGLRDDGTSSMLDLEKIYPLFNTDTAPENYRPSPEILALARQKERLVLSRWDTAANCDRTNYITTFYAIGSVTGGYGSPQEKLITVELASTKKLPVITIVPDIFDAPYGTIKRNDASGHGKASHLFMHPVAVQHKNELLVLCNVNPSKASEASETVATNVLLPAHADTLWFNGKKVNTDKPFRLPAQVGDTVAVREGRAGVVIRFFGANGLQNQTPTLVLQGDADGLKAGIARFTVYHYQGKTQEQTDDQVASVFLITADECPTDTALAELIARVQAPYVFPFAKLVPFEFRGDLVGGDLVATNTLLYDGTGLAIGWDSIDKKVSTRDIMLPGSERAPLKPFRPLIVNGDDVFARLLGSFVPPDSVATATGAASTK